MYDYNTNLLVIKLSAPPEITDESVKAHLKSAIQGGSIESCDDNLAKVVDVARVRKIYKLNGPARPVGMIGRSKKHLELLRVGSL